MPKLTLYFSPPPVLIFIALVFNFITFMYLLIALVSIIITVAFDSLTLMSFFVALTSITIPLASIFNTYLQIIHLIHINLFPMLVPKLHAHIYLYSPCGHSLCTIKLESLPKLFFTGLTDVRIRHNASWATSPDVTENKVSFFLIC